MANVVSLIFRARVQSYPSPLYIPVKILPLRRSEEFFADFNHGRAFVKFSGKYRAKLESEGRSLMQVGMSVGALARDTAREEDWDPECSIVTWLSEISNSLRIRREPRTSGRMAESTALLQRAPDTTQRESENSRVRAEEHSPCCVPVLCLSTHKSVPSL